MRIDFAIDIGTRLEQEDRHVITWTSEMLGVHVLDGHSGSGAVDVCSVCLENDVLPRGDIKQENEEIVRGLQNIAGGKDSGCTLSSVYIRDEQAYASILGDSPVILIKNKTIHRLPLHETSNKKEVELRIKAGLYKNACWPNHLFINERSGLSCLRTIGDKVFGDAIGREPEFHELGNFDYIIIATDGLKLPDEELLKGVNKGAKYLIKQNLKFLTGKPIDNTTVIIIKK